MARTQPLVVRPQITQVSTCHAVRLAAREVPKKALAYCLVTTTSPGPGARTSGSSPSGDPAWNTSRAGTLR